MRLMLVGYGGGWEAIPRTDGVHVGQNGHVYRITLFFRPSDFAFNSISMEGSFLLLSVASETRVAS